MMAFAHMREDDMDAPIRMPNEDSHYKDHLTKAVNALSEYSGMSLERAKVQLDKEYAKSNAECKASIKAHTKLKAKYLAMLAQVNAWTPPTEEHESFKVYMADQLTQAIKWDCNDDYYIERLEALRQTPKEWLGDQVKQAKHDIEYYTKHLLENKSMLSKKMDWINAMIKSVPLPKKK